ncbi:MAG: histidine kinase [Bacteroidales bacterium]
MVTKVLYIISIILQLFVAILALRFITFTRIRLSWMLISSGFLLMAFRRFIELSAIMNTRYAGELSILTGWIGIATSIIIAAGVWLIRDLFFSLRRAEVDRKRAERKVLTAIMNTEEKERKRFAEDMHDGLGPLLSTIKLYVNELVSDDLSAVEKKDYVNYVNQLIDNAVSDIRTMSNNLTPRIIHEYGLVSAIDEFCKTISRTQKLEISFKKTGKTLELNKSVEINIYRIVNELLNNTIKHAGAQSALLTLTFRPARLVLRYSDDGKGFDYEHKRTKMRGEGINNIITRVNSIDGQIKIFSQEGKGFSVQIDVPIK